MARGSAFWLFASLAAVGTALPLTAFVPWVARNGLDPRLFFEELYVNSISSFFAWDMIVSGLVTIALILIEGRRSHVPALGLPIAGTLLVGVSCGLPLFLALRERALAAR
jgi:hypothetical protein